jgi:two-component system phosphate regulon sensor histidine kinase PhoR
MARSPEVLALLEALPDATALLAPGGRVACANALFRALFGNALEGRTLLELTRDADAGLAVAEALAGATRKLELTLPVARRSLQVFLSPFGDGALLTARDITEAKRMERARRDFVANASHELRTPVTAIFGAAETLLGGAVNEPAAALGFVEMIARHADRLSRLTQELLDLSRIESGEWEVQTTPLAVFGLATSTLELFRPRADQKKLTLRCTVEANLQVFADRRALEQVLVNLLDNAVKYTPAGGAVTLSGARQASTGTTWGACSSASTASIPAGRATPAGPGWGWRSSSTWPRPWAARSASRATARAAASGSAWLRPESSRTRTSPGVHTSHPVASRSPTTNSPRRRHPAFGPWRIP